MDLSNILSITGKGSLYKLISRAPNSFIVEGLEDGHRFPAFSHDGVATLDNIAIFTEDEEVSLQSVFQSIFKKENGQKVAVPKDNNALKAYFAEVLPNYDRDRVYVSNIKKVLAWYNILTEHQLIDLEEEKPQEEEGKKEE
ncbi:MAG: DUF5606 domain-containing protein [Bacteroidales bacterium]|jgi:hypothetical protein|nr:DUF5606 domain-containing protein [Bacteroidales bacterium]